MKRVAGVISVIVLSLACIVSLHAQSPITDEANQRHAEKAEKQRQKQLKKTAKMQEKARRKTEKAQRKAMERAQQRANR